MKTPLSHVRSAYFHAAPLGLNGDEVGARL